MIWSETRGSGRTVVLTHGWGDTADTWAPQMDALAEHARVVRWDLLGHGRSDAPDDPGAYTRDGALRDLEALVGNEPAVLVGHSLGGQLSLAFALRHPDLVSGLGLLSTGPGYRDEVGRERWNRSVERQAAAREARGERGLAHAVRGYVAQHDSSIMDGTPSIDVPTLVLVGADDTPFLAAADWFERRLPQVTKVILPGAGHSVSREQPEAVARALLDLLRATESR